MPEQTTNYNLIKPLLNETADIAVINQNMDTLDSALKAVDNKTLNAPDDSVSDDAIGERTPDSSQAPSSPGTGKVGQVLSWITNRLKTITGKDNWWDAPVTTIEALNTAMGTRASTTELNEHKADYTLQVPYGGTTSNTGNDYVIANPIITALSAGMAVCVKINADSTGAATLNWNSKGAKLIKKANGNSVSNLKANGVYTLRYDGANFILQGEGGSGNATASDLLSGKTASTDAGDISGSMTDNGTVNITPGTANQTIAAGKHSGSGVVYGDADLVTGNIRSGINIFGVAGKVSVVETNDATASAGCILSGYTGYVNGSKITGTMANNGAVTITPSTSNQYISAGYHNGNGYVQGDSDLVNGNIRAGANIFGIAGKSSVVETSDANASVAQILSGYSGYVNGSKISGNMPNHGAVAITPGTSNQAIAAGYHNGSGYCAGDGGLVAGNIKSGVSIFGVAGTCSPRLFASGTGYINTGGVTAVTGISFAPRSIVVNISNGLYRKFYNADIADNYSQYTMWHNETINNTGNWTVGSSYFSTILYASLVPGQPFVWIAWG